MHHPLIKDFTEAYHHDHHLPVDASNPKSNAQKYHYYLPNSQRIISCHAYTCSSVRFGAMNCYARYAAAGCELAARGLLELSKFLARLCPRSEYYTNTTKSYLLLYWKFPMMHIMLLCQTMIGCSFKEKMFQSYGERGGGV